MKISDHIDKLSWSVADKLLYVIYGIVSLFQIRAMDAAEFGLFAQMIGFHTWIFVVSDSFALQNIIQFGANLNNRGKVNLFAFLLHSIITIGITLTILLFKEPISVFFNQPRLVEVAIALPILIILTVPRTFCLKLLLRDHKFKGIFFVNLAFFGLMTLITVLFLFFYHKLDFQLMIILYFSGTLISSIVGILICYKELIFSLKGEISLKTLTRFSFPLTMYSALYSMPKNLDIFIIQYFFSTAVVGVYQSAKNLFRFFEEGVNLANGLVYPAAVKLIEKKDNKGLNDLITKATSAMLFAYIFAFIILEIGLSHFIITTILPQQYFFAVDYFNLMIIAALGMPFMVLSFIIIASGKPETVFKYVLISLALFFSTLFLVGYYNEESLIPLGIVVFDISFGIFCFSHTKKMYNIGYRQLLRFFSDSIYFLKQKKRN